MPAERDLLACLSRDELLAIADAHALTTPDRRAKDGIADAIAAARVDLAASLSAYSRDRLKELCRALKLDDSGRDKASIVARLTGSVPAVKLPARAKPVPNVSEALRAR